MIIKPSNSRKVNHKSDDQFSQPIKAELQIHHQNQNLVTIASFNDPPFDPPHQLTDVPIKYSLSPIEILEVIKDHIFDDHLNISDSKPDQAGQVEYADQLQSNGSYLPEISTPSATQSMSSSTSTSQQYLSVSDDKVLAGLSGKEKPNSFNHNSPSIVPVLKKASPDGYNWRKYGQKQLRSPEGSRSYYRCTHCNCCAKKIECSDRDNHVVDILYKSHHNHDPPNRVRCSRRSRPLPFIGHSKTATSSTSPYNAVASISLKTYAEQKSSSSSSKEQCRDGYDEKYEINVDDDDTDTDTDTDEVEPRKRPKKKSYPNCVKEEQSKARKKPKLVVRAAGDVVISGDGFRWRKYGQKMVKGNPHPRNYYRCTFVGCPVRKHIERDVDDPIASIITYKGVHGHDMPVPKNSQGLPSGLIAGTDVDSPAPLSSLQVKACDQFHNQVVRGQRWRSEK